MVNDFIARRRPRWERLQYLIKHANPAGRRAIPAAEVEELGRLYRQATSDLAIARRDFPRDRVVVYLEQLVGRAHLVVYRDEGRELRHVLSFFTAGFPRLFRQTGPYTLAAFLMFAVPALVAFLAVLMLPAAPATLIPDPALVEQVRQGRTWFDIPPSARPMASTFIMTNNIQVAFLAFGGGALLGVGAFWVLLSNGVSFGAVAGLCQLYGLAPQLWAFVLPHGVIELSVIFIAGGAGLSLGHAVLSPGLLPRRQALVLASERAVRLIVGCVPLLVIAGTIEGFVSPSSLPPAAKIALGLTAGVALYAFFLRAGRQGRA